MKRILVLAVLLMAGCGQSLNVNEVMMQAKETSALNMMVNLSSAMQVYGMEHEGYTSNLKDLKDLLKPDFAEALEKDVSYQGYHYYSMPTESRGQFYIFATPAQYGVSGNRTFAAVDDGSIYSNDLKGQYVTQKPDFSSWTRVREKAKVTGPSPDGAEQH